MTKKEVLDFQLPPRFEQIRDEHRKQMEDGSIAYDVALILLQARTPRGWDFRERQNAGELQHVVAPDGGL